MSENPSAGRCMFKQWECQKKGREEEGTSEKRRRAGPAREEYVGFSEGSPPAGPEAESVHVCVRQRERDRAASSLEVCGI